LINLENSIAIFDNISISNIIFGIKGIISINGCEKVAFNHINITTSSTLALDINNVNTMR
jgi:hypothetical protein